MMESRIPLTKTTILTGAGLIGAITITTMVAAGVATITITAVVGVAIVVAIVAVAGVAIQPKEFICYQCRQYHHCR